MGCLLPFCCLPCCDFFSCVHYEPSVSILARVHKRSADEMDEDEGGTDLVVSRDARGGEGGKRRVTDFLARPGKRAGEEERALMLARYECVCYARF